MINKGKNLELAVLNLKKNNIVVIPTETVYGLGANAIKNENTFSGRVVSFSLGSSSSG